MARIIIADDASVERIFYEDILGYLGHECVSCKNGLEAVERFNEQSADLVILDYEMPGLNGAQACERIRSSAKGVRVPIIMVSSHDEEDFIMRCMNAGANDYLMKPVNENHLVAKLKNLLNIYSLNADNLKLVREKFVLADRYRLSSILGYGAHAVVFLADDLVEKRQVAVKLLNRQFVNDEMSKPFMDIAEKIKNLDCRNILKIYSYGQYGGQLYLVLEYVPGGDLRKQLKSRRFSQEDAARLGRDIANALQVLDEHKILHLDLKPENILFDGSDYKLGDFGMLVPRAGYTLPLNIELWSTAAYAPPETLNDLDRLSIESDVYALGIVLFEAVTGVNPFQSDQPSQSLYMQVNYTLPPLDLAFPVSEFFSCTVEYMLRKNADHRPWPSELVKVFGEIVDYPERFAVAKPRLDVEEPAEDALSENHAARPGSFDKIVKRENHAPAFASIIQMAQQGKSLKKFKGISHFTANLDAKSRLLPVALAAGMLVVATLLGLVVFALTAPAIGDEEHDMLKSRVTNTPGKDLGVGTFNYQVSEPARSGSSGEVSP